MNSELIPKNNEIGEYHKRKRSIMLHGEKEENQQSKSHDTSSEYPQFSTEQFSNIILSFDRTHRGRIF